MSKLKLTATVSCVFAALTLSLSSPPAALAHKGAMGIVKERMDKFEASEKATKRIKQALSRGDTAAVTAEAEFLVSWAREMESYFPENSNRSPSEAKDEIWLQWDDFVGAIRSFDDAAQTLIEATPTEDPRAIRGAFKEMTKSCKSCHQQFRED
jgi:cytochrome c556